VAVSAAVAVAAAGAAAGGSETDPTLPRVGPSTLGPASFGNGELNPWTTHVGKVILDSEEMRAMSTPSVARTSRYLGAAFVFQFATSLAAGMLSAAILTGGITETLLNISANLGQLRMVIVLELLTSAGIVVMASLLYVVLRVQQRAVALVALGFWIAEAVMLAVKALGLYSLLAVSGGYVDAGTPAAFSYEPLGTLSLGISQHAGDIGMFFFCLGALLWYSLLLQSRIVPRLLSLWGLVAVVPVLVATMMLVWDRDLAPGFALYWLYIPFELVLGLWLLIKGANVHPTGPDTASAPNVLVGGREEAGDQLPHHSTT
jgi:hypothetical protein